MKKGDKNQKKVIVVLGPTASGKSELAVRLALRLGSGQAKKKFRINDAEVVSTDSRQIYKGMDIGTGKISKKEMRGIPHHLLDIAFLKRKFTVIQYRKLAMAAINNILRKNKVPILCGGTGFYIQAIVDGIIIPEVKPDWKLRKELERKTTEELFKKLKKLDPKRAKTIEKKNKRRLIRALEIIIKTRKPVPVLKKSPLPYPVLIIGIKKSTTELEKSIKNRFFQWLKEGFLKEVISFKNLPAGRGLSWRKIEEFGLHYRQASQYLQGKINEREFIEKSLAELRNYAKRQMTWFKRDKRIHWIKNQKEAEKLVKEFLNYKGEE